MHDPRSNSLCLHLEISCFSALPAIRVTLAQRRRSSTNSLATSHEREWQEHRKIKETDRAGKRVERWKEKMRAFTPLFDRVRRLMQPVHCCHPLHLLTFSIMSFTHGWVPVSSFSSSPPSCQPPVSLSLSPSSSCIRDLTRHGNPPPVLQVA